MVIRFLVTLKMHPCDKEFIGSIQSIAVPQFSSLVFLKDILMRLLSKKLQSTTK